MFNSKDFLIPLQASIRTAISCIDRNETGIVLVTDNDRHLLGTITDGDIRRAILSGLDLETSVDQVLAQKTSSILYAKPVSVPSGTGRSDLLRLMQERMVRQVPLLDENERVVNLVTIDELLPPKKLSLQAVVTMGESSTRLHPLTADLPKPMLPIGNRPLMDFTINQLRQSGIKQVNLVTHYKKDAVVDHFGDGKDFGVDIRYLDEEDQNGAVGVLRKLAPDDSTLLVINGDVLTRVNYGAMLTYHEEQHADMTVAVRMNEFRIPYEVVESLDGCITCITEKPSFQRFVNAGVYLINTAVSGIIPSDQYIDMAGLINCLIKSGKRVVSFPIHEYWRDIQGYDDYRQAVADVENGVFDILEPGSPAPPGFVPLCVPELRGNEWAYIKECLDTNWVSSVGAFVDRFEQMLADFTGNKFAVAASSGTTALHIALLVAGIQPDDEVIMSTLSFIAPANAVRYTGAWPVFIDSEPDYWQMDPYKLAEFIEQGCRWENGVLINLITGRKVRAIIPVHILGHPCDMDAVTSLAHKYNLTIIEDATESLGAKYKGQSIGHIGDISCFSFNGNKLITTGGGGMIATDNEAWAKKAKYLTTQAKDDPLEYIHNEVGYNYRLTNLLAAMGCAQMEKVQEYIEVKRRIATIYGKALAGIPGITTMKEASWATSVFWLYTVLVDEKEYGMDSRELLRKLSGALIQARPLWQPLHASPAFTSLPKIDAPVAEWLNRQAISLPCSVGLIDHEQERVIEEIRNLGKK
jgi:perosamine synthetase